MNIWDRIHYEPMPSMPFEVNLADVQAFDISDALSFWCRNEESGSDWRTMSKTFPNVAPPFRRYFMFGRRPQEFRRETVHKEYDGTGVEVGVFFFANRDDASGTWEIHALNCSMARSGSVWVGDRNTGRDFAWHVGALRYYISETGTFLHALPDDESGRRMLLDEHEDPDPTFEFVVPRFQDNLGWTDGDLNELTAFGMQFLQPFWLATSLMHCKNVTAARESIPPKLAKAAIARGRPRFSYSVLDIKPMTRVLETEGGIGHGTGLKQALHICRGHFKDYRDGSGLFGKHKGLYWWEQNLRGSIEQGVHDKDYRLKTD